MRIAPYFEVDTLENIKDFVCKNGFGILINQFDAKFLATHIPLQLDYNENGKAVLVGHVAKSNSQTKNFETDAEVLVIFNGPHSYVSSSWYNHENVPTWNYIAVHIYGKIKKVSQEKLLLSLSKLVDKYEAKMENPVSVSTISEKFMNREIKGIVGFEIEITEIYSAHKLSQNRDEKNKANIISELKKTGDENARLIALEMAKAK